MKDFLSQKAISVTDLKRAEDGVISVVGGLDKWTPEGVRKSKIQFAVLPSIPRRLFTLQNKECVGTLMRWAFLMSIKVVPQISHLSLEFKDRCFLSFFFGIPYALSALILALHLE